MTLAGTVQKTETIPIQNSSDVVMVRQRVRAWTIEMKFSLVEQTKIVTAASELGRNTLEHGGGGSLELANHRQWRAARTTSVLFRSGSGHSRRRSGVERRVHHRVPAWVSGWAAASGLMNEFEIDTKPGSGTRITAIRWK